MSLVSQGAVSRGAVIRRAASLSQGAVSRGAASLSRGALYYISMGIL